MDNRFICKTCGAKMEVGSQPDQYICPYCGEVVIHKESIPQQQIVYAESNQNPTQNIKVEVVMPHAAPQPQRIKNKKLNKIMGFAFMFFVISVCLLILFLNNGNGGGMFISIISAMSLVLYPIFLGIGIKIAKSDKTNEERDKISLTYPSAIIQINLFAISFLISVICFILFIN